MEATDTPDLAQFTTVDQATDPAYLISLMDYAEPFPGVARCRQAALAGLQLAPGRQVLDLGCGTGTAAAEMARLVAPGGSVTGLDLSEQMLTEARRRVEGTGLALDFEAGDAQALGFADATFDACRTERMLVHVPDVVRALAEMVRVLRPGGRLCAIDVDFDGTAIDHPDRDLTRTLVRRTGDSFCNGQIGRQLPRLLREAGLVEISVDVVPVFWDRPITEKIFAPQVEALAAEGDVAGEDLAKWMARLVKADTSGDFYCCMPFSVVTGVKP